MLVSHKHRFIFIKTRKTAGTSVEVELAKIMVPTDLVTPVIPAVEGHVPRNHDGFWNHMPARKARRAIGRDIFDSYLKFAIEREPVDKCISFYSMVRNSPSHKRQIGSWDDFVRKGPHPVDTSIYTSVFGKLMVDRILRYENLEADLTSLMGELGVEFRGIKSKAKGGWREEQPVTETHRAIIYQKFSSSNRFSGYSL